MTSTEADLRIGSLEMMDLLARLSDGRPTPAGGSAAALGGALAAALICKVARLTLGREQYAGSEHQMRAVLERATTLLNDLTALADEDSMAYSKVIAAYAHPQYSDEEKTHRSNMLQEAFRLATEIPLTTAAACGELVDLAATGASLGNRNAASDASVAALLAYAGLQSCAVSVQTNLESLRDYAFVAKSEAQIARLKRAGGAGVTRALMAAGLEVSTIVSE